MRGLGTNSSINAHGQTCPELIKVGIEGKGKSTTPLELVKDELRKQSIQLLLHYEMEAWKS